MSKRFLAVAALALGVLAVPAAAADLRGAPGGPVDVPDPGYSWSGLYVGLHLGYGFGSPRTRVSGNDPTTVTLVNGRFVADLGSPEMSGFTGGAQIGFNWQAGRFVYGLETDLAYTDFGASQTAIGLPVAAGFGGLGLPALEFQNTGSRELEYLGTVRARIGYTLFDEFMVYATGGLAYGGAEIRGTLTAFTPAVAGGAPAAVWSGSNSGLLVGYTLGAGAEVALHERVTLKLEYLWYDLGSIALNTPLVTGPAVLAGSSIRQSYDVNGSVVRAGVNYRF